MQTVILFVFIGLVFVGLVITIAVAYHAGWRRGWDECEKSRRAKNQTRLLNIEPINTTFEE